MMKHPGTSKYPSLFSCCLAILLAVFSVLPAPAAGAAEAAPSYTVEFTYDGREYVLAGGDAARLSDVLSGLGLSGEPRSWQVSDGGLFDVFPGDENGVAPGGDISWLLSLQPFHTEEWLKVVLDGIEYEIIVTDDNTTYPGGVVPAGYSGTIKTCLDDTVAVDADTYYQNAIDPNVANPTMPTIVKQSQSTDTIYDFAAGLPLSTIFIDETKLGQNIGTYKLENQAYAYTITHDPASNRVFYNPAYDPAASADGHLKNGESNDLSGPLFSFTFEDAAILKDGTRANVKITYSNAQLFTDERLAVMEKVAREHLQTATEHLENASTPVEFADAQAELAAAEAELAASYLRGNVALARGSTVDYYIEDTRNLGKANNSTGLSQAQVDAGNQAITERIKQYQKQEGLRFWLRLS